MIVLIPWLVHFQLLAHIFFNLGMCNTGYFCGINFIGFGADDLTVIPDASVMVLCNQFIIRFSLATAPVLPDAMHLLDSVPAVKS